MAERLSRTVQRTCNKLPEQCAISQAAFSHQEVIFQAHFFFLILPNLAYDKPCECFSGSQFSDLK